MYDVIVEFLCNYFVTKSVWRFYVLIVLKLMDLLENLTLKRKLVPKNGIYLFPSAMSIIDLNHKTVHLIILYTIDRARTESCAPSSSKACREKQRRDRLNDK